MKNSLRSGKHNSYDMRIFDDEIFGTIAGLFGSKIDKEVVAMANTTEVGFARYFYSKDINRIYRVAEALEVGIVGVHTGIVSEASSCMLLLQCPPAAVG